MGSSARGEHAWPGVERDVFGWLDAGARLIPPTFYHHRFLRPRRLRKWYLDVIRRFGGRGRLPSVVRRRLGPRVARRIEVDVLVVGGGRSGAGGGGTRGQRWVRASRWWRRSRGRAAVSMPGVQVLDGATVLGWYDGVVTAIDEAALWSIRAGARHRGHGVVRARAARSAVRIGPV